MQETVTSVLNAVKSSMLGLKTSRHEISFYRMLPQSFNCCQASPVCPWSWIHTSGSQPAFCHISIYSYCVYTDFLVEDVWPRPRLRCSSQWTQAVLPDLPGAGPWLSCLASCCLSQAAIWCSAEGLYFCSSYTLVLLLFSFCHTTNSGDSLLLSFISVHPITLVSSF